MANAYPELPRLKYEQTTVQMIDVISHLSSLPCVTEIKRMAYIMFRQESGNGTHGINNNYSGIQADGSRWPAAFDAMFSGTVEVDENGTGKPRLFLAFHQWQDCVSMLVNRVQGRGLYIGEPGIKTEHDLAECYYRQWVTGNPNASMPPNELTDFYSMYGQAAALFRNEVVEKPQSAANITSGNVSHDTADELNAVQAIEDAE